LQTLAARLRYVSGDYQNPETFTAIRKALGDAAAPLFYLAIPPSPSARLRRSRGIGLCPRRPLIVEKPFGRDLASANEIERHATSVVCGVGDLPDSTTTLARKPVLNLLYFRFANAFLEALWNREHVERVDIHDGRGVGVRTRGRFYEEVGAIRECSEPPAAGARDAGDGRAAVR
jgi:glucose-6-phosphate 1-dehydrogenase